MATICSSLNYFLPTSGPWNDDRAPKVISNQTKSYCKCEIFPKLKGQVVHIPSGDIYDHINHANSDRLIRFKMFLLFFWQPIGTFFVGAPLRAVYLCSGHWAWSEGYSKALARWKIERYQCNRNNTLELAPDRLALYSYIAQESLLCLSKAVIKLATLPAAVLLAMGVTLLAIPYPLWARRIFALIEETWSVPLHPRFAPLFNLFMNFRAPCMQPERIWEGHDFYTAFSDTRDLWSNWRDFRRLIQDSASYLPENAKKNWIQKLDNFSNSFASLPRVTEKKTLDILKLKKMSELSELHRNLREFIQHCDETADQQIDHLLSSENPFNYDQAFQKLEKDLSSFLSLEHKIPVRTQTDQTKPCNQNKE